MSENYLPVKESLGYKNVKKALLKIFSFNLDNVDIRPGNFENFGFNFNYKGVSIDMIISATGKNIQFEFGEGGVFDILLPDPNYPDKSIFKKISIEYLFSDKNLQKKLRNIFGDNEQDIEFALQVLKDYLDQKCEEGGPSLK